MSFSDKSHLEEPHNFEDDSEDESLVTRSFPSAHFSSTEERVLIDHDLKLQALEALHGNDVTSSPKSIQRRPSIIEFPNTLGNLTASVPHIHGHHELNHNSSFSDQFPEELVGLFTNVQEFLNLRKKYMKISNQLNENENPKNKDTWEIYPPPPLPTYKSKNRFNQLPLEQQQETEFDFNSIQIPNKTGDYEIKLNDDDIFYVVDAKTGENPFEAFPSLHDFYSDLSKIQKISSDGPSKSFAFKRLKYLQTKWEMYYLLNEFEENKQSKKNPHRDFYNVRKVDTHIHHSACMNQKHLLRFIKYKLKTEPDKEVIFRDGKVLTLAEVFESLNLTGYDLSIDTLDMHAHTDTFHRFDKFNLKYNPIGESRLREIFLKTDNFIKGEYLAELTKQVFEDLESSKYQHVELRISIYGRSIDEWDKLASWIVDNKLFSHNVRWLIQVPRLFDLYKTNNNVETFQDIMTNLFKPLFEVSIDPSSHPKLHVFLQRVVGFDSVDDESKQEKLFTSKKVPRASEWNFSQNPPYSYYMYYLFGNIVTLNQLRLKNKFNTFLLRPHCGEAGDPEHLISAFLTAHSISHGILLRKIPFIQYLFYLDQIGLAMSPLSNNALFLTYDKNPFFNFFQKGLNVSLSTDDPLQFSFTKEPLIEEYSVAAQIYKLSGVDMCELACNSVRQSGWEAKIKKHWIGKNFMKQGVLGNDIEKTNVPDIRVQYREETLQTELKMVERFAKKK